MKALGGNAAEEYPDYLGQCASLDENLGKLVEKLKEKGLYENTVILYASDHGSHFKTRNRDAHLNGYDDYKRSCHDGCLHVPLVICGGPFKGGKEVTELVSTESIPKTLLALAGVDVGDKMIGENLLDVVEKKNHNRANEVYAQISESRCGRCIRACKDVQGIAALTYAGRSSDIIVTTAYNKPMETTDCILCGQCSLVCPTGALVEKDDTEKVLDALQDPKKHVIVQVAPSVRVSLGDAFGMEPGAIVTGQMVTALRLLGFDKVFDTNFGADLTIMEEGTEFLDRLQHGGVLPMMTSCCPGWVSYVEKHYSDCLPHLSSTKSPMSIFGAVAKTYYPKAAGIDPKDIVTVSVMPCTAKKFEAARPEMGREGRQDVDIVLTTRELIKLIKYVGLSFGQLPETDFDSPLGTASGAGAIFGTTGGVMEAALRTVCDKLTGKTLERLDFQEARGFQGIKECTLEIGGHTLHIAIAHTLKNAEVLMEQVRKGISPYDFIEVMACPGGCIGGGGQPVGTTNAVKKKRMQALYEIDRNLPVRKSHENPVLQVLYRDFLGEPGQGKAHELLHTSYNAVPKEYRF